MPNGIGKKITHPVLLRQLKKLHLSSTLPDEKAWTNFIERIQKTYQEYDQERYQHERTIEVSSRETAELNQKLEYAQELAALGYWQYERDSGRLTWSKEMYVLFEEDYREGIPSFETLMNRFKLQDKILLQQFIDDALNKGQPFEFEAEMKTAKHHKKWVHIACAVTPKSHHKNILRGIMLDITKRKETEKTLATLNEKIIRAAHEAGMAEIAASVLHNIGNILNSVNISLELLEQQQAHSEMPMLIKAVQMMLTHLNDLHTYLTQDEKGKLLPDYLNKSIELIVDEREEGQYEIKQLKEHITHINEIVKSQNILSGLNKTILEHANLAEIINYALTLSEGVLVKLGIHVTKHYPQSIPIHTDRNKLIQILSNLFQNAAEAIEVNPYSKAKKIRITTYSIPEENKIAIVVKDSGIGISREMMRDLFTFGFTTKPKGHGFGLHSCLLLTQELNGELKVSSVGAGKGTTFTLTLPVIQAINVEKINQYEEQL